MGAIAQGMEGGFLQTNTAEVLRNLVNSRQASADKQELLAFLSGAQGNEYAPASGEIVELATLENDAEDTAEALEEDKAFAQDMEKNCAEKTGMHEKDQKLRSQEVVALADTIKILNDDDALELFKKTLPSSSSSFLQIQRSGDSLRREAQSLLEVAQQKVTSNKHRLDFVMLALNGRKAGLGKIVKLIDDLVVVLKKEQNDDNDKREYCNEQFDQADDKKKGLERTIADVETVIAESTE